MKKRISFQQLLPYLAAFLIPVVIMLVLFIQRQIFPFGDRSFMRTDLYHQYVPFHQMLREALQSGKSLQYTWDVGLGTNMVSLFAYYLCTPTNLLLLFCPSDYVIEFISYITILKIGLASVSFTFYLSRHSRKSAWYSVFFGILYGMSGYVAAYSWNIMWLDCIWLFPLIVYSLERLLKTNKGCWYAFTLGLAICTNYYIAIMICMFLVLYFIVQMIIQGDELIAYRPDGTVHGSRTFRNHLQKIFYFGFYSLLAGGLSAIMLLPAYYALKLTASANTTFPKNLDSYFTSFEVIARHLICVDTEQGLDHWPNIYCGIAPLVLLPLYVLNKDVKIREKVCYFILALFFIFSFRLKVLNYIWHGFHFPNSLPARHSFLYIFLILTMAYKGFCSIRERTDREIIGSMWGVILIILIAETIIKDDAFYWWSFLISILFAAVYGGILNLTRNPKYEHRYLIAPVLIILIIEMTINTGATSITTCNRTTYVKEDSSVQELLYAADKNEDSEFYRVEKVSTRTKNDGAWLNYKSGSIFSSAANAKLTSFYKSLGMEGSTNAYSMTGATPVTLSLFNVKYSLSKDELHTDVIRNLFSKASNMNLYRNVYALELGFVVDPTLEWSWTTSYNNPIMNQNDLAFAVAGMEDMFFPTTCTMSSVSTSYINVDSEGYVFAYVESNSNVKTVEARYTNGTSDTFKNVNRGFILDLGYRTNGETITLSTEDSGTMTVYAYVLDLGKYIALMEQLNQEPMIVDRYDNTSIDAHVTTKGGRLVTSIPYDPGYTVTVDGEEVLIRSFKDALISFDLEPGEHTIHFSYKAEGLALGCVISIVSLILLLVLAGYSLFGEKWLAERNARKPQTEEAAAE